MVYKSAQRTKETKGAAQRAKAKAPSPIISKLHQPGLAAQQRRPSEVGSLPSLNGHFVFLEALHGCGLLSDFRLGRLKSTDGHGNAQNATFRFLSVLGRTYELVSSAVACGNVTCFVTYKTSTKRIVVNGMGTESDVRQAILASPLKDLAIEKLLIQASHYISYFCLRKVA